MKLQLIAIAAAIASLAGTAHAGLTPASAQQNGTFALVAFDSTNTSFYVRDLGFFLNSFLPNSVTPFSGETSQTPGDKTPEAGLTLTAGNTTNFGDAAFSTWLATTSGAANIRWFAGSWDNAGTTTNVNTKRAIISSANPNETVSNTDLDTWTSTGSTSGFGGIVGLLPAFGLSGTGTGRPVSWDTQFGLGGSALTVLGNSASLFYSARTPATLSNSLSTNLIKYGNSANFASLTFASNGDLTYSLAPAAAVPLPAAAWMMGAGLLAVGGMVRRRRAAAQA